MKYRNIKPQMVVRLPELEINYGLRRVINRVSNIGHFYWLTGSAIFLAILFILMPYRICSKILTGLKSQGILAGLVLIFGLTALSLVWSKGQDIDVWIFEHFNVHGRRTPWLDWVMLAITQLGSGVFGLLTAFVIFLTGSHLPAYHLAFGTLTLWLVVELLKILVRRTRPYNKLNKIRIVGKRARGYSFPSGHTSQSFFIATLLAHSFQTGIILSVSLYGIAMLVGLTRIYVGMHYPRDVLGGTILGSTWGILGVLVNNYIWSIISL